MTGKVLGSLSEISRDSTKPTEIVAEQENNFCKDCEKRFLHTVTEGHLLMNKFE